MSANVPSQTKSAPVVTLRDVQPADLPALFLFQSDPESCAMAMVKPRSEEAFTAVWNKIFQDRAAGVPNIVGKAILVDGQLAGAIGCFSLEGQCAVGYGIAREQWGRGVATAALRLLLAEFSTRPLHARAAASNAASIRVLLKNGFVITGRHQSPATERYLACEELHFTLAAG